MGPLVLQLFPMDEEELIQIWENFAEVLFEDYHEDASAAHREFYEDLMRKLATGEQYISDKANETDHKVFENFFGGFSTDKEKTVYRFVFSNIVAEGNILKEGEENASIG